jgi:hypothetical protein
MSSKKNKETEIEEKWSDIKVLVAQPIAPGFNLKLWEDHANRIYRSFTFANKTQALYPKRVSGAGGRWATTARARQNLLDEFLDEEVTHVFWIDSDIIEIPPDSIERLLALAPDSAVAPYVYLEENPWWPYKRFYDITGFVDKDGADFDYRAPHNRASGDVTAYVRSAGTCYLVPAQWHREIEYDPHSPKMEHLDFFDKVRAQNHKVIATPEVEVIHAFLPKYGESFH